MAAFANATEFTIRTFPVNSTSGLTANNIYNGPHAPWWSVVLMALIVFVTIVTNLLVIVSFIVEPRLRQPFNFYLLNLSVNDFVVGALGMTYYTAYVFYGYFPLSSNDCTVWIYFDYLGTSTSLLGILIIAIDRTWAVTYPISYKRHNSICRSLMTIAFTWVLTNLCLLPTLMNERIYHADRYPANQCHWDYETEPILSSSFVLIVVTEWTPCCLTVVCYLFTLWKLRQRQRVRSLNDIVPAEQRGFTRRRIRVERQANILLTLLFVTLVLMWSPWFVYQAWTMTTGLSNEVAYLTTYWIAFANSGVNPFLFNAVNDDFRNAIRKMIGLRCAGPIASSFEHSHSHRATDSNKKTTGSRAATEHI